MSVNTGESSNNPVSRSSQNKSQLLEAMMRNVPKLKELNYTQWKNIITNSIKKAKLWEYVDGSIEEPSEHEASKLTAYYDEATAVRNAILGSLEPAAQRYIEEALDPREAWLALEKKYLTAESDADARLVSIEQQLADLRLEEGGDVIEHIAEFCRMRSQLGGSRFVVDDQACVSMMYRSLPSSYRQSVLTPEGVEMKDFSALCARLTYVSQNPGPEAPSNEIPAPIEDYSNWGVPGDIKLFGLTGDKNPLLEERAIVTCRDCLLKDHKAGTPECPQYEWRKELWGTQSEDVAPENSELSTKRLIPANSKRLSYEFSEPVKVVLSFDELGLKPRLRQNLTYSQPSAVQQCAILPIIQGRNVHAEAPPNSGKTTTLAISILHIIDATLACVQALVFVPTSEAVIAFKKTIDNMGSGLSIICSSDMTIIASLTGINKVHIFVGTPENLLGLTRRNIINMRKLRVVVLDDFDRLIELGMEGPVLEVYRYVPPLAQVIASSTVFTSPIPNAVSKMLADPLQILVHRNEGVSIGTHFYVIVPETEKPMVLSASFSSLGAAGFVLVCNDLTGLTQNTWSMNQRFYYLRESGDSSEYPGVIRNFTDKLSGIRQNISRNGYYYDRHGYDPVSNIVLAITDAAFDKAGLSTCEAPLINYEVPSNVVDYVKRLDHWHVADPKRSQMIITFITAGTDEINIIRDFERCYGVHFAELLWDAKSSKLY